MICAIKDGMTSLSVFTFLVAVVAGAVAAISGFGVGSLLTPLLAARYGTKLAVAIVSVPHLMAPAARFAGFRKHLDRRVFLNFGVLSAVGRFAWCLAQCSREQSGPDNRVWWLAYFRRDFRPNETCRPDTFWAPNGLGCGSTVGIFWRLAGDQGGIRSASLSGFDIRKEALVATTTAVALIVDGARMPIYLAGETKGIIRAWPRADRRDSRRSAWGPFGGCVCCGEFQNRWFANCCMV